MTPAVRCFIARHLERLQIVEMDDEEAGVHRDLLKSVQDKIVQGKIDETEVELASWIASGKLRERKVVDALIKTFYEAQRNIACGRVTRPQTVALIAVSLT